MTSVNHVPQANVNNKLPDNFLVIMPDVANTTNNPNLKPDENSKFKVVGYAVDTSTNPFTTTEVVIEDNIPLHVAISIYARIATGIDL